MTSGVLLEKYRSFKGFSDEEEEWRSDCKKIARKIVKLHEDEVVSARERDDRRVSNHDRIQSQMKQYGRVLADLEQKDSAPDNDMLMDQLRETKQKCYAVEDVVRTLGRDRISEASEEAYTEAQHLLGYLE